MACRLLRIVATIHYGNSAHDSGRGYHGLAVGATQRIAGERISLIPRNLL
jgi:hypothetical protein